MTSSSVIRQWTLHKDFWKSAHDFQLMIHRNFVVTIHGFRENEVLLQARNDVLVISPPGGASRYFIWRIVKD